MSIGSPDPDEVAWEEWTRWKLIYTGFRVTPATDSQRNIKGRLICLESWVEWFSPIEFAVPGDTAVNERIYRWRIKTEFVSEFIGWHTTKFFLAGEGKE